MPKVNGKEYPYTEAGMKAAKKAAAKKKSPAKGVASKKAVAQSKEQMKEMKRPKVSGTATTKGMPSKAMNKAIPGNKGVNIGAAAKKFIMSTPPAMAAKTAVGVGRKVAGMMNPAPAAPRQMRQLPGTLGQLRKMNEVPVPLPKRGVGEARPMPLPRKQMPGAPMPMPRKRGTTKKLMGR